MFFSFLIDVSNYPFTFFFIVMVELKNNLSTQLPKNIVIHIVLEAMTDRSTIASAIFVGHIGDNVNL